MTKGKMSEQLLNLEKTNPDYRDKFEKEVRAMYEKKLRTTSKIGLVGIGAIGGLLGCIFYFISFVAFTYPAYDEIFNMSILKGASVIAMSLCIAWVLLAGWVLVRGRIDLRIHPSLAVILGWLLMLVIIFITISAFDMLGSMGDNSAGEIALILMIVFIIFLPLMALMLLLSGRQERMRIKMQQKILELEFQLAQLRE
jgi:hypothetical protein